MRVIIAAVVVLFFCSAHAQVPRGFARPVVSGHDAVQQQRETPSGAVNAKLGMAGLHKLAQDPSTMAEVMELLKDPAAMAEAKAMMDDPAFRREMEKIAGPLKQQMQKQFGSMQAGGEANVRAGPAAARDAAGCARSARAAALTTARALASAPVCFVRLCCGWRACAGAARRRRALARDAGPWHARRRDARDAGPADDGGG